MKKKKVYRPFSDNRFDMWRLSKVGGMIAFDKKGIPHFVFPDSESYEEYLKLNNVKNGVNGQDVSLG